MTSTLEAWFILIDHNHKPLSGFDTVRIASDQCVVHLKQAIKAQNLHVPDDVWASNLTVMECAGTVLDDENGIRALEEQIHAIFSSPEKKVSIIGSRRKIEDLRLTDENVLLIQVPGALLNFSLQDYPYD